MCYYLNVHLQGQRVKLNQQQFDVPWTKCLKCVTSRCNGWNFNWNYNNFLLLWSDDDTTNHIWTLYLCNNTTTLKIAATAAENMLVRMQWIKYIIHIVVYFVAYLYIMDLINVWKKEHFKTFHCSGPHSCFTSDLKGSKCKNSEPALTGSYSRVIKLQTHRSLIAL